MGSRKGVRKPQWPDRLETYRGGIDGWRCRFEWKWERAASARRFGFSPLPLIEELKSCGDTDRECLGCPFLLERWPWLREQHQPFIDAKENNDD